MATKYSTDRDGKSKTASAVDADHYPEQNEIGEDGLFPSVDQIEQRAYEIWVRKGRLEGTAEQDWFEAEQELKSDNPSEPSSPVLRQGSGSVQR